MNKELLMLHGAAYAVIQMIDDDSWGYGKVNDGRVESVEWKDILDYLVSLIENTEAAYKVHKCCMRDFRKKI